ncbi:hypothetical protein DSO57_1012249 [Entomophthora muscae]|uniref:Uncharacterized protein n=1 Tax=Entomophthora muscae TaxID=34485 RepID=A0ACC2S846_9FUNG|nr:hypothetical protein DSO57_1012249 [Entomophthora muscae]
MQGYTGSSNSEACVYGHSQPSGPSPSTTQECVLSPAYSSMALFAHHTQAAANPNHISTMASRTSQLSQGATHGSQNPETANQMATSSSQDGHIPPPANHSARHRRRLIIPEIVLKMVEKQGMLMSLREIAAAMDSLRNLLVYGLGFKETIWIYQYLESSNNILDSLYLFLDSCSLVLDFCALELDSCATLRIQLLILGLLLRYLGLQLYL